MDSSISTSKKRNGFWRFFLLLAACLCLFGGPLLGVGLYCAYSPSVYSSSFYGELSEKWNSLRDKKDKKKIVIIGGSSVPFGLRSNLIEKEFPEYQVVDFGLYASIGTKAMIELSKNYIGKGDIVILSPESDSQALSDYYSGETMLKCLDANPNMWSDFSEESKKACLYYLPSFLSEKNAYLSGEKKMETSGIYQKSSFNSYGDISYSRDSNKMAAYFDTSHYIDYSSLACPSFVSLANSFSSTLEQKGASTYYYYAPSNVLSIKGDASSFHEYLRNNLRFEVLGYPSISEYEPNYFYDSNFHLNDAGAILHTRNIISYLKLIFNDPSPISFDLPTKPALPEIDHYEDEDPNCSDYQLSENPTGFTIEGLSEEGKKKDALTTPLGHLGQGVNTIGKSAFKDSIASKIYISKAVTSIFDEAFEGASSLKEIHLSSSLPSSIPVGKGILVGANEDIKIYIPKGSFGAYMTDYFWSVYSSHFVEEEQ